MADIYIRNIDARVKAQLMEQAKRKGCSLNEYVKSIISTYTSGIEVSAIDDRYRTLVKDVVSIYNHALEKNSELMVETNYLLSKLVPDLSEEDNDE